jgi:acetyl-CoA carboxylase carboxyl transferase subunit alpha
MPHPEGYRKAIRLYRLAERLGLPVVTFIDTPGAFPGPASEERGVAEAIARCIQVMAGLRTPIVTVITGEGGSGGALALAVGDVVIALENSIYSVISPEGAASILWRSPEFAQQAAVAMRLTAADQLALGVIDEVIPEPRGGAHEHADETAKNLRTAIAHQLDALAGRDRRVLLEARYARYRRMGEFADTGVSGEPKQERGGWADRLRQLLESGRSAIGGGDGAGSLPIDMPDEESDLPLREDV